jgi:hypothetical protein
MRHLLCILLNGIFRLSLQTGFSDKILKEEDVMKRLLVCTGIMVAVLTFGTFAAAATVTFDFNDLAVETGLAGISGYMTGIFGAPVTVETYPPTNAITFINGPGGAFTTNYLASDGQNQSVNGFAITFPEPVVSVSFDWDDRYPWEFVFMGSIVDPSLGIDPWGTLKHFDGTFASPVTTLTFRNNLSTGLFGIDNLTVTTAAVPEPTTLMLLGLGLLGLSAARYRTGRS